MMSYTLSIIIIEILPVTLSTDSSPNHRAQIDAQTDNDGNCYTASIVTTENIIDLVSFSCTVKMWKMPSTYIIALIIVGQSGKIGSFT